MNDPLLSVIIPVYNSEQYLTECIDSILNQTYRNIEIILVDDGSTDGSGTICDTYAQREKRVRVIHQDNRGVSSARNTGLSIAQGDFFAFVDSDDICERNMYQSMVSIALETNVDMVICSGFYFSQSERNNITPCLSKEVELMNSSKMITDYLWHDNGNTILFTVIWNKLFRSSYFKNIIAFREDMSIHEDEAFATSIYLNKFTLAKVEKPFYGYRKNVNSITYRPFSDRDCSQLLVLYERAHLFSKNDLNEVAAKSARNFCEVYITYYFKAKKASHPEWVTRYRSHYFEMLIFGRPTQTFKDKIRLLLFYVSPSIYKFLTNS